MAWDRGRLPTPIDQVARGFIPSAEVREGGAVNKGGVQSRTAVVYPFWDRPPASATDFFIQPLPFSLPAGPSAAPVLIPGASFQLPAQNEGVVRSVSIFVDAPTTALNVVWSLRINGQPVAGADALTTFPRSASNLSITFEYFKQVPVGALIELVVSNRSAAGPWTVGGNFAGWSWPMADRIRVFGESGQGY